MNFRNHILGVKTAFLQHMPQHMLMCWEVNRWQRALKCVYVLVKHDLVYERQSIKYWFIEDKIKL
jgi:hypothetical protein